MTWSAYLDPAIAAAYARLAAPIQFAPPARDLVALLRLRPGAVVLDVGSGTGVAAVPAMQAVGPSGRLIAVDASFEMLRASRTHGAYLRAVAAVPRLPLRDGAADAVLASFVVTHFDDYRSGLADMMRICRSGGRVGISAWGTLPNAAAQAWNEVAGRHLPLEQLQSAFREHIPWDEWFSDAGNLRRTLGDAGLTGVEVTTRVYHVTTSTADYLALRELSVQGTLLRRALDDERWNAFRTEARNAFHDRFGFDIAYDRDVHFGIGLKP